MFPILAEIIYLPGTSPTNLPSSKINPEAVLLLSNDFPVKENSRGMFSILLFFLSYAIASKLITSPDRALKTSDFKSSFVTGFSLIFKSIVADRPSKTTDIFAFPS